MVTSTKELTVTWSPHSTAGLRGEALPGGRGACSQQGRRPMVPGPSTGHRPGDQGRKFATLHGSALAKAAQGSAEDVCTQETEPPTDQVRTTSHLRREGCPDLWYQGTWKKRRRGCAHAEPQNRRLGREPWHTALCTAA